jgi:tight adherence protein C
MQSFIEAFTRPEVLLSLFAACAIFATAMILLLPSLSRDRLPARMRVMATERDKMRATRLAQLNTKDGAQLRQTPQGFMLDIVDKLDLRASFDTEEVRDKLKMAGLRGQAPLVAYMFFRLAMPIIVTIAALIYLFLIAQLDHRQNRYCAAGRLHRLLPAKRLRAKPDRKASAIYHCRFP